MILASILFSTAGAVAFVDLGKPGAMEQLAQDNPTHHALVRQAIEAARYIGCDGAAQMFKARGGGGGVTCTDSMLMTSYPAKKRVSVRLDAVTYSTNVTLTVRTQSPER